MSEISITAKELDDFYDDAKNGLSDDQVKLLDAICKIAWQTVAKEESLFEGFEKGFADAFKPDEAELILKYANREGVGARDAGAYGMYPRILIK